MTCPKDHAVLVAKRPCANCKEKPGWARDTKRNAQPGSFVPCQLCNRTGLIESTMTIDELAERLAVHASPSPPPVDSKSAFRPGQECRSCNSVNTVWSAPGPLCACCGLDPTETPPPVEPTAERKGQGEPCRRELFALELPDGRIIASGMSPDFGYVARGEERVVRYVPEPSEAGKGEAGDGQLATLAIHAMAAAEREGKEHEDQLVAANRAIYEMGLHHGGRGIRRAEREARAGQLYCSRCVAHVSRSYEPGRCYAEDCEPAEMHEHDEAITQEEAFGKGTGQSPEGPAEVPDRSGEDIGCSFCGKRAAEVNKLVACRGEDVLICNECVSLCNDLMGEPKDPAPALAGTADETVQERSGRRAEVVVNAWLRTCQEHTEELTLTDAQELELIESIEHELIVCDERARDIGAAAERERLAEKRFLHAQTLKAWLPVMREAIIAAGRAFNGTPGELKAAVDALAHEFRPDSTPQTE